MIRKPLVTLLFIFAVLVGWSQSKVNYHLAKKIAENVNSDEMVHAYVKGDVGYIAEIVSSIGGSFNYSSGGIASVAIPLNQVHQLINSRSVDRIELHPFSYLPLNDSVLSQTNTIPVHSGAAPLPQGYDGTGIVIGYIDTGIDITHPDFKDNLGHTRIKYLWDHRGAPGAAPVAPPTGFAYGVEWDSTEIANGQCTHLDWSSGNGHGTHVIGIGSGNGLATGQYKGVAPESDIIVVALNFSGGPSTSVSDAVQYIYAQAKAMGKPCVINASIGGDMGSHDGLDLQSQLIKSLIDQDPGQAFVAAAGNSGNIPFHLRYDVTADTNFTLFARAGTGVYFEIYADTADFKNVQLAIGADQMAPVHSFRGRTNFAAVSSMPLGSFVNDAVWNNGNRIGRVDTYLELNGGVYALYVMITPDSTAYNWRLTTKGSGKFDLWNFNSSTGVASPIVNSGLPTLATMPDSMYYKMPDKNKTVATGFQCLDNVVTVANYINRNAYVDVTGTPQSIAVVTGAREITSAVGPTRDGRVKPDIASPGHYTLAALDATYKAVIPGTDFRMAQGGMHIRTGSTSHAAPSVSGIAALYLQKNPSATATQVQQAIIKCPIQDSFTGSNLPDDYWGYGKVNAFGALNENLIVAEPSDVSVCEGSNAAISLAANGTGLGYQWVIVQGGVNVPLSNIAPYSGVTTATLTVTPADVTMNGNAYRCVVSNAYSCDVTSGEAILTVNSLPVVTASATANTVCLGSAVTLSGGGATSYSWTGGVTNGAAFTPSLGTTSYTVTGTDGNNCSNMATTSITVNNLPTVTASATPNTVCLGSAVTLSGGGATSYSWTGGVTNGVVFTPSLGTTTYTVTGTDGNNCSNTATTSITVNNLPTVTASATANTVCLGAAVTLSGGGAVSYNWSGGVTNGAAFTPSLGTTTYTVAGTDGNNCSNFTTTSITVNNLPTVIASATANTVCFGATVTLSGIGALSYNWSGGVTDGVAFTPLLGTVTYTVTGADANNCSNTASADITVVSLPVVTLTGLSANYCFDADSVTLSGSPAGGVFSGNGITNSLLGEFNPIVAGSGSVTVTYTYTDANNCTASATQSTTVLTPLVSKDTCPVAVAQGMSEIIANVFTPNGDGINDEFKVNYSGPPASDFSLTIFDRWGSTVFKANNPNVKWDGRTMAGVKVSSGTYYYVLLNAGKYYKGYILLHE